MFLSKTSKNLEFSVVLNIVRESKFSNLCVFLNPFSPFYPNFVMFNIRIEHLRIFCYKRLQGYLNVTQGLIWVLHDFSLLFMVEDRLQQEWLWFQWFYLMDAWDMSCKYQDMHNPEFK